jgi:hypothetical protein
MNQIISAASLECASSFARRRAEFKTQLYDMFLRFLAASFVCSQLSGCVPIVSHYHTVEVTDARYLHETCGGFGPRTWAYFPVHGIFISLRVPNDFGVIYPKGTIVELDSNELILTSERNGVSTQRVFEIAPRTHGSYGSGIPDELYYMVDPIEGNAHLRSSKDLDTIWASYSTREFMLPTDEDLEHAIIRIPAMTINGIRYDSQELTIVRKTFVGTMPINC